jgi:hypothetical protein
MTDLRDQLRALVDGAAEPVRPAEVIGPRALGRDTTSPRVRRPIAPALAGVAAIAVAVAGMAVVVTRDHPAEQTTAGATRVAAAPADPTSCYPEPCRDVDDAEASALLGVQVAMPSGIPVGWELVMNQVDFHPAGSTSNGGVVVWEVDTVVLGRRWSPPGESDTGLCPTTIALAMSPARPGSSIPGLPTSITLPDGTSVLGSWEVGSGICGNRGGEEPEIGSLWWTHAGVSYQLRSIGIPAEVVRAVVVSLP